MLKCGKTNYICILFQKMKTKKTYDVAFTGLQNGVHSFTYNLDQTFFQERAYSPIENGNIDVELEFEKQDRFFVLNFRYGGVVNLQCDRCASDLTIPVNNAASLLVKLSDEEYDDLDDEVMYIHPSDVVIDFSQFLYESIVVNVPLYKTCEDDISGNQPCDEKIIAILEREENEQPSGEEDTDPRWEMLKQLKLKNNGTSEE